MTHEVQGRMLLREWFAWWDAIPRIDAEQRIGDYNTLLLGSPGWIGVDREERLKTLFEQAYGRFSEKAAVELDGHVLDADEADTFRRHSRNVFGWMLSTYQGTGVMYSQGQTN
jgi:hypothetical protein